MAVLEFILAIIITICLTFIALSYIITKWDKENNDTKKNKK